MKGARATGAVTGAATGATGAAGSDAGSGVSASGSGAARGRPPRGARQRPRPASETAPRSSSGTLAAATGTSLQARIARTSSANGSEEASSPSAAQIDQHRRVEKQAGELRRLDPQLALAELDVDAAQPQHREGGHRPLEVEGLGPSCSRGRGQRKGR